MAAPPSVPSITPPVLPRRPFTRTHHGDAIEDPYAWTADRDDAEFLAHLRAENAFADDVTAHLADVREDIFHEIKAATLESDVSVPEAYRGWWYYSRTVEGEQYPITARTARRGEDLPAIGTPEWPEEVVCDGNREAQGHDFFSLAACEVDLTGRYVVLAMDRRGDERFQLSVREIASGARVDEAVTDAGYGVVWDVSAQAFYYTRVDESWRPYQVWRHVLGTDAATDTLLYEEPDERFWLGIGSSRDDSLLVLTLVSKSTAEVHLLDLTVPGASLRCVSPRVPGVEYEVEPAGDRLLIVHNRDRQDFSLAWAPLDSTSSEDWTDLLPLADGERVVAADAFAGHVVVSMRSGGLTALRILPRTGDDFAPPWDLPVDEAVWTIGLAGNLEWETDRVRVVIESFVTPKTVCEYDVRTGSAQVLKRQPVLGYDPAHYLQSRQVVQAADGVSVPISVVRHRDAPLGGPGLLYGYGAYEISSDPWFSIARLSLLRRGVTFAVAHVRGGGELGRSWYEQGRLDQKENSFTDLNACARFLTRDLIDPARLGLYGGSAGGLLVGAAVNVAPELYRVVHADVPFVDALTTILDPTLPLTVPEWEEWGDPLHDPQVYARMKGYTPYENIGRTPYPAVLATSSLNDTRVYVTEPAKWVARLRERVTSDLRMRPILLRTEMEAGHGGRSGRYDAWRQVAWEYAFLLDQLDALARLEAVGVDAE